MTKLQRSLTVAVSTGISAAQIAADLGFVPGLSPAVAVLVVIAQLCENVRTNKNAINQLYRRCCIMTEDLNDTSREEQLLPERIKAALDEALLILQQVQQRVEIWSKLSFVKAFMSQQDIADGIRTGNAAIDNFGETFNIASHLEIHKWQVAFEKNQEIDQDELVESLSKIDFNQDGMHLQLDEHAETLNKMMAMLQSMMSEKPVEDISEDKQSKLADTLYKIHSQVGGPLPNMVMDREVRILGEYPVDGTLGMDVWEGMFLEKEKVSCRMIRGGRNTERYMERFAQEREVWLDVFAKDKGEHIVPFYGVVQNRYNPYVVSPWQSNGKAIDHVKQNPDIDHKEFIKAIAKGIEVLHTMDPPIIHRDIRGESILVSDKKTPLLADFGMSKILEDISGGSYTKSTGILNTSRWAPYEINFKQGTVTTKSDIFSFGMTVLELLTGKHPWNHCVMPGNALLELHHGKRPHKPEDEETIRKGFNDGLWDLLLRCWQKDQAERPTIQMVIKELDIIWPESDTTRSAPAQ